MAKRTRQSKEKLDKNKKATTTKKKVSSTKEAKSTTKNSSKKTNNTKTKTPSKSANNNTKQKTTTKNISNNTKPKTNNVNKTKASVKKVNKKQNRDNFLIIETILIVLIIIFMSVALIFEYKTNNLSGNNANFDAEYISQKTILKEKENRLNELNETLTMYADIDAKIDAVKNEYFTYLKELETGILNGTMDEKIAYLTFDDGPYYNTYKVLDILDKYNIKATFFTTSINGEYCYDKKTENCLVMYQEYLKRGHTIANHTYTHGIFKGLYSSVDSFMNAVIRQEEQVSKQTGGYVTNILRFPGGSSSARRLKNAIIEELRKRGYGWVDWSAQDGDGGELESKAQAWSTFKNSINSNIEVVLFHDYSSITTSILPDAIEYLQNKGYILLPLFYESSVVNK